MAHDPVCGMNVEPQSAAGRSDFQGTTYYFCSPGCKTKFDQNPRQYAPGSGASADREKRV